MKRPNPCTRLLLIVAPASDKYVTIISVTQIRLYKYEVKQNLLNISSPDRDLSSVHTHTNIFDNYKDLEII